MFNKKRKGSGDWKGKGGGGYQGKDGGGYKGRKGSAGGWKHGGDRKSGSNMHRSTCAECNSACQVPFKPNGSKPILCSSCFQRDQEGSSRSNYGSKRFDRPSRHGDSSRPSASAGNNDEVVNQLKKISVKMDLILRAITDLTIEVDGEEGEDEDSDEGMKFK